jgi:hypothetical protein
MRNGFEGRDGQLPALIDVAFVHLERVGQNLLESNVLLLRPAGQSVVLQVTGMRSLLVCAACTENPCE